MARNIFRMLVLIKSEGNKSEGNLKALHQGKKGDTGACNCLWAGCNNNINISRPNFSISQKNVTNTVQITVLLYVP